MIFVLARDEIVFIRGETLSALIVHPQIFSDSDEHYLVT